jgi:protocatechuate 3,4-dioxygenase beta subunit
MTLSRRNFLGLASLLLAGCGSRASRRADAGAATLAPTPFIADDDGPPPLPATSGGTMADAATCTGATAANIEGPFYKAGAPHRAVLVDRTQRGERLVIAGSVLTTDCEPIAGAELDIWHADARGAYDLDGYIFRGVLVTDDRGRFELRTIVPGRYLNGDTFRPAHVHVKLRARGHRPLTTQLYFPGDPYNDGDPFIVESLIMQTRQTRTGRHAAFDFVLG